MSDIFSVHQLVATEILSICPNPDDTLKEVIRDLGSVKSNESELMSVSSSEISLTLNPKLHNVEGKCTRCRLDGHMLTCDSKILMPK